MSFYKSIFSFFNKGWQLTIAAHEENLMWKKEQVSFCSIMWAVVIYSWFGDVRVREFGVDFVLCARFSSLHDCEHGKHAFTPEGKKGLPLRVHVLLNPVKQTNVQLIQELDSGVFWQRCITISGASGQECPE